MRVLKVMAGMAVLLLALPTLPAESKRDTQLDAMGDQPVQRSTDGRRYKVFEYEGEKFNVFEPESERMAVEGMGLTAYISIHKATGMYRESLDGWGTERSSLKDALDGACGRIIDRVKQPGEEELRKGLDEFFEGLK